MRRHIVTYFGLYATERKRRNCKIVVVMATAYVKIFTKEKVKSVASEPNYTLKMQRKYLFHLGNRHSWLFVLSWYREERWVALKSVMRIQICFVVYLSYERTFFFYLRVKLFIYHSRVLLKFGCGPPANVDAGNRLLPPVKSWKVFPVGMSGMPPIPPSPFVL